MKFQVIVKFSIPGSFTGATVVGVKVISFGSSYETLYKAESEYYEYL